MVLDKERILNQLKRAIERNSIPQGTKNRKKFEDYPLAQCFGWTEGPRGRKKLP